VNREARQLRDTRIRELFRHGLLPPLVISKRMAVHIATVRWVLRKTYGCSMGHYLAEAAGGKRLRR
jgi:hypothetical protein